MTKTLSENFYLKRILENKVMIIPALAGHQLIINEVDGTFASIDTGFDRLKGPDYVLQTKETSVEVHQIIDSGTLQDIFCGFPVGLDELCFSQSQIIDFVKNHKEVLYPGHYTFFLSKSMGKFFVVSINSYSGNLNVSGHDIWLEELWDLPHRIVIPQLDS